MTSILDHVQQINDHAEAQNDEAFMLGAREDYDSPVIFIDTEALDAGAGIGFIQLKEQLDHQVPGAFDELINRLLEELHKKNPEITRDDFLKISIDTSSFNTPITISNLVIEGQEHCLMLKPDDTTDTKAEFIHRLTRQYSAEIREKIAQNMPGNDQDWNRLMGNHESGHCRIAGIPVGKVEKQAVELRVDRGVIQQTENRNQGDMALAWKDLRHLGDYSNSQIHATGALLNSGDNSSALHIEEAATYKVTMNEIINDNFDWDTYEGEATKAKELMEENPELYFQTIDVAVDELKTNVMEVYNKELSDKSIGDIISAQIRINYIENFEDAYRRRAMGQDIPEREPTQLLPQEVEDEYYAREDIQIKLTEQRAPAEAERQEAEQKHSPSADADKGYKPGKDGTPYTTEVRGIPTGLVEVDFESGVSVGVGADKTPITHAFDQSANPAPQDITLVNAQIAPPITEIIPPIPVANNSEYSTQSYA